MSDWQQIGVAFRPQKDFTSPFEPGDFATIVAHSPDQRSIRTAAAFLESVFIDTTQTTDEIIVERICAGDRAAFDVLYERYWSRVFHYVDRRLRNRADTEETVQEVFFRLFSSLDSFRGDAAFGAWVFGLTRRTIANRFKRKQHPTVPLDPEMGEGGDLSPFTSPQTFNPHEAYECQERIARMSRAAGEDLSSEQWDLVRRHHLEDHSIQEIALSLAKSENAVKSNLYRARKLLLAR